MRKDNSGDSNVDILLVDDREDGLITLEALLCDNKDFRLVKAQSGHEAIALLDSYDFAVILLDVQMPQLDGFQTAEIIRSTRHQHVPIVFVTAINKDERYVYRGYEAGAVDYIFKPFDPMILRAKVSVFVALHLQSRKLREQSVLLSQREALEHRANLQAAELENLRRYRNLADSIPHIVFRSNHVGDWEYHNRVWSKFTGLGECFGRGWLEAVDPRDLADLLKHWERAMARGEHFEAECRLVRHDGQARWHWLQADPELCGRGQRVAWLGTATDIEDRKTSEVALNVARRKAEAANDAKTHFLANMSHEIRTPLNAIMGFTELLLDPEISIAEKLKSVSIVRRNGGQLLKIVDEILDISKVEAGGLITEKVDTRVGPLLQEVRTLMSIQADKKGIALDFDLRSSLPSLVRTDSTRLRQILINVLGNAIKFTSRGRVQLISSFATHSNGRSFLRFEVNDTGLGVDASAAEKIFEPFSQADSSTTRIFGGTGLGLPLSRRLARALGGDVRMVHSEPGQGSCFVVEIEVEVADACDWIEKEENENEPRLPLKPEVLIDRLRGKRILLVEDAEDNQFLITQFLSHTGLHIEIASNGQEGVDKALAGDFQVVLMDIQMPLVDGYEATERLRLAGYSRPIIALTAHALIEEREKSLRTGCNGHLTKPINRSQLIESLAHFI